MDEIIEYKEMVEEEGKTFLKTIYSVTVRPATASMGMTKTLLTQKCLTEAPEVTDYSDMSLLASRMVITFLYPNLVAGAINPMGFSQWPPSYDEFRNLPDTFVADWEAAVFRNNPRWQPQLQLTNEQKEQLQKKATNSTLV